MKLAELGEFGLIDRIAQQVAAAPSVPLGIGDDAAALLPTPENLTLITCDMLLEGVHFDLNFCDPHSLGRKSLAVNISDLAAMGAVPRHCLLGIALPAAVPVEFMDGFMTGMLEMAGSFGVTLVGGDTCASKGGIAISITALGEQRPERVLKRSGAKAGDLVYVSGTVGDAAAGLKELRSGRREGFLVSRQLDPTPRVAAGVAVAEAGLASAMIDVSDGVLSDLGHICEMSKVAARVELARLPLSDEYRALCGDDLSLALSGGEDYELLFCVPQGRGEAVEELFGRLGLAVTRVGAIVEGSGIELVAADGSLHQPGARGFDHFG
ncbi:thiamine-phosphate kinase [Geomonas sp.]|uniref:thiamine-phosphate kinase n=1 Tax=Geomonas sp. TaxID=2651584 RepID=UPI002B4A7E51|nr:thiamine-phosphate kinase [Geomonas sp.]HJV35077.1 thiamine-phosphate kinase [Geomonas sp.]